MIKPKHLSPGDTIGVISPSSGPWQRSEIWRGIDTLKAWGFNVKVGKNAYKNYYYLAGDDQSRAEDLNAMFQDDEVDAVFCSQGGYGAGRILHLVDYEAIRKHPKIFLGYSDITALHLAIMKKCDLVTFHGPTVTGMYGETLTQYRKSQLFKAVMSNAPVGNIELADKKNGYVLKITPGKVKAPIVGGNLTLICSSMGTPYEIDTKGKILFFEDLDTEPWIMDHMLTHLLNAGKLQEAVGIVAGKCSNCEPNKYDAGFHSQWSLEDLLFDRLQPLGIPTICGLPMGHTRNLATLPLGMMANLDANAGKLTIVETATA
ncbi:MAG: LD-carboxypeptidase [Eubacteriales bacterium]|nr:LD-carboxypeptidase [Eubacteriales bacterium]